MRVGLAADHGGFALKQALAERLQTCGYAIVDFGAFQLDSDDDYPDFVIPLAHAVAGRQIDRGVALCGSGVGASVAATRLPACGLLSFMTSSPPIRALKMTT